MKPGKMRFSALLLAIAMLAMLLLSGCEDSKSLVTNPQKPVYTPEGTAVTLKVLVDAGYRADENMGYLVEKLAEEYRQAHSNVVLEIEYLPGEFDQQEERDLRIQQLRAEILADDGPDIFLMTSQVNYNVFEPLFKDTMVSVRNRVFRDFSGYYDADDTLGKDCLNQTIMDSGVVGSARYILPIRYDFPVLGMNESLLPEYGLQKEQLTENWLTLYQTVLEHEDPSLARCVQDCNALDCFGELIDYENRKLLITKEMIAEAMRLEQQMQHRRFQNQKTSEYFSSGFANFVEVDTFWLSSGTPIMMENVSGAFETAVVAKALDLEYDLYPIASDNGDMVAYVTFWGAIAANCKAPDVAYDFLRLFLSEEAQWETTRPTALAEHSKSFYGSGIPVRTKGMVAPLLESIQRMAGGCIPLVEGSGERNALIQEVVMDDSDFPILNTQIDEVRFDNLYYPQYSDLLFTLNDIEHGGIPSDVDIDKAAADFVREMEFFLAES